MHQERLLFRPWDRSSRNAWTFHRLTRKCLLRTKSNASIAISAPGGWHVDHLEGAHSIVADVEMQIR